MHTRAFNKVSVDYKQGCLVKSSSNIIKLKNEINYYLNLPLELTRFFPKLLNHAPDFTTYTIEYFPYKNLAELIIAEKISKKEGENILKKLMDILSMLHSFKLPTHNYHNQISDFYIKKTLQRIEELKFNNDFYYILQNPTIKINNKLYKTFKQLHPSFIETIKNKVFTNFNHKQTIIHGDFCFSNILYCPINKDIKLIDPRGSFEVDGIYGHPYYDYAKLLHCVHGKYDYIINNDFELNEIEPGNFSFKTNNPSSFNYFHKSYLDLLKTMKIDIEFLYLIEGSLFLSMAALHYECAKRQKAFFLIGLIIINNFYAREYKNLY